MTFQHIGIMSPGDMGQAIAIQLKQSGFNVYTALGRRSERTRTLGRDAGLIDLGSVEHLTEQCDLVLSVMNPGAALEFAGEVALALSSNHRKIVFADCNAVAPATMQEIGARIHAAGADCVDGGIIGQPPRGKSTCHLYVSGPKASSLRPLANASISVHVMSERIGDASAMKMCYAALTKGMTGLVLELLIAARKLGVDAPLAERFRKGQAPILDHVLENLPKMPPKAHRWVPEMHEIANTFQSVGLTPAIFNGIADLYDYVARTRLGKETPENRDASRGGMDVVNQIADE